MGICGGIAAYKAAILVRELTRLGAQVKVVMTDSALAFITPMTMQALSGEEVRTTLFDSKAERAMGHIELARWADYLLIAPASANCLAKMAHGIADDLLSTLYLVAKTPVIVCPAMNHSMWAHPATQANCEQLIERGVVMVGPEEGSQACGEYGYGRLSEVEHIVDALRLVDIDQVLKGQRVLITAGPTIEPIDPVRYISNRSSGKMGYAIATAARRAGAQVTLISGPSQQRVPEGVDFYPVDTAKAMFDQVMKTLEPGMIFIGAAAVADFAVKDRAFEKIKKQDHASLTLQLEKNPDLLACVAASGKARLVMGFAAETHDLIQQAKSKLTAKQLDMIVANLVGDSQGFDVDENEVIVLTKTSQIELPLTHKTRIAGQLIAIIAKHLQNLAKESIEH